MKNEAVVARNGLRTAGEKWVWLQKGNTRELCDNNVLYPDSTSVNVPDMILFYSSQDGTAGENLVKGAEALSVLFPTKARESTIILKINK